MGIVGGLSQSPWPPPAGRSLAHSSITPRASCFSLPEYVLSLRQWFSLQTEPSEVQGGDLRIKCKPVWDKHFHSSGDNSGVCSQQCHKESWRSGTPLRHTLQYLFSPFASHSQNFFENTFQINNLHPDARLKVCVKINQGGFLKLGQMCIVLGVHSSTHCANSRIASKSLN